MLKAIDTAERKQIMLEMLEEVDRFCREKGITYFLVGGTLLGAVRHKGFIPWDDDVDIGMPRKDYEHFLQCFQSDSGNVAVHDFRTKKHYIWASAKAIDVRTVLYEVKNKKTESGVYIDIFPFDGVTGEYSEALRTVKRMNIWKKMLTLKYLSIDRRRNLIKNLIVVLGKALFLIPDSFIIRKINYGLDHPMDITACKYICNFAGAWGIRELSKASDFSGTMDAVFEGKAFQIPIGYDDYLKTVYGEYMAPPPVEKRVSTHTGQAYWREQL